MLLHTLVSRLGLLPECPWSGTDNTEPALLTFPAPRPARRRRRSSARFYSCRDPKAIARSKSAGLHRATKCLWSVNGENRLGEKPWSSPLWWTDGACKFWLKYPVRSFIQKQVFSSYRNPSVPNKAFNFKEIQWMPSKCIAVPCMPLIIESFFHRYWIWYLICHSVKLCRYLDE